MAIGNTDRRRCVIHSKLGTHEVRPGGSLRMGRHTDNDLVLDDTTVSRFHARIAWDKEFERPVLFDNGSQNGTSVDGVIVNSHEPLRNQAKVVIGNFEFKIELQNCGETPAVLNDTNDMVTLFSEDGPNLNGTFGPTYQVRELLERLERERRTGTLVINVEPVAKVVYCLGRIMSAEQAGLGRGLRAIELVLKIREGTFRFTRELEPQEEAMNLWVSDYLRSRMQADEPAEATTKFRATRFFKRIKPQ